MDMAGNLGGHSLLNYLETWVHINVYVLIINKYSYYAILCKDDTLDFSEIRLSTVSST